MNKLKNLLLPFLVVCALIFSFKVAIVPTYAEHQKPPNTEENNNTEKEETDENKEDTTGLIHMRLRNCVISVSRIEQLICQLLLFILELSCQLIVRYQKKS
ncbi:MAG: hypothetical protein ACLSBH_21045 [Coprobacillus cateniformis]